MKRLALFVALLCVYVPARATVIMPLTDGELVQRAQSIASGRVVSIRSAPVPGGGGVETFVRVAVGEWLRGRLDESEIVLRMPGGRFGDRFAWVEGSPDFSLGEDVLLLLAGGANGELRTVGMYQGKLTLSWDAVRGRRIARRQAAPVTLVRPTGARVQRSVEEWRRLVRERAFIGAARRLRALPAGYAETASAGKEVQRFTLMNGASWPPQLQPVGFRVAPGFQAGTTDGGRPTVQDAMRAWSDVPGADIKLYDAGNGLPAPVLFCNFANEVNFNDPFNEIPDGEGILAVGGFCSLGSVIFEGNLTFNNDEIATSFFALPNCFAHVATHELGHTIGIGHSQDPQAIMAPTVSPSSCRGTSLAPDDVAAVQFLYGGGGASGSLQPPANVLAWAFGNLVVVWFTPVDGADQYDIVALGSCDPCAVLDRPPLVLGNVPDGTYQVAVRARSGDAVSRLSRIVVLQVGG